MNIDLHIDRLILDGFSLSPRERAILRAAFEGELTRLLYERGLNQSLASGGTIPSLNGGNIQVTAGTPPARLGVEIAQSVYGGIGKVK
jgi:hypothetical protein